MELIEVPAGRRQAAKRRALALLYRLEALDPPDYRRHAQDLAACRRLLVRLGLPSAAERAELLEAAAWTAWRQGLASKVLHVQGTKKHFCAACGELLRSNRARTCSTRCRVALHRGVWTSPVEAQARASQVNLNDLWCTPPELLAALVVEWGPIALDAAATERDTVTELWISPDDNALEVSWGSFLVRPGWVWVNPPYSARGGGLLAWLHKAHGESAATGRRVVVLAPPGVGAAYRAFAVGHASEVRDLRRRLAFLHPETRRPQRGNREGSTLFIFAGSSPARVGEWDPCL